MLYSEIKERENRFITALKIAFPFLLLLGIFFHASQLFKHDTLNFILLILLIPVYVYYTVYLIYYGFQTTLIDPMTKTFNRTKILSKIEKIKHKDQTLIVLLHVKNLSDINERYGLNNGDNILKKLIEKLQAFLIEHHLKNVPIGRYSNSMFLFYTSYPYLELKHFMMLFTKSIQNAGIDNIEVKIDFAMIGAHYDESTENIIEKLILLSEETDKKEEEKITLKPDAMNKMIVHAIQENRLFFKYQPCVKYDDCSQKLYEILTRIDLQEQGILSKQQIQRIVNHAGYEKEFDEKVFGLLLEELKPLLEQSDALFCIEISPVSLRNTAFKRYLQTLFKRLKIDPNRFILEIIEKKSYEEMGRFNEIVKSYRELGFKIALGNFGGNNASIEYLKYLTIDWIKFDIEFTKNIEADTYRVLLKHYIELARSLHIRTMIKFVDKKALFEKAKVYEPDFIQGFYISKPKTIGEIDEIR